MFPSIMTYLLPGALKMFRPVLNVVEYGGYTLAHVTIVSLSEWQLWHEEAAGVKG